MSGAGYNDRVGYLCTGIPVTWKCDLLDNYNCKFGGTSAACPVAAGVAALLSVRFGYLWQTQLTSILQNSAVDLGDSSQYGHGRVDAFRAVLSMARGDCNNDGNVDIGDVTALNDHLFLTFEPLFPTTLLGDVNCDGYVDIGDQTTLVNHLMVTFEPLAIPCYNYDNADW
jgi:hypothetical protein